MFILIGFAFLGGIVTILSPCILPILPLVLSGSITGGKRRPLGVVTGFIASFTFFTLFLSAIVRATGISADALRIVAVVVIAFFGLSLVIPSLQKKMEVWFSRLANAGPKGNANDGYVSGVIVGLSLGIVWTPCVGPILAAIITLAATASVDLGAVIITLAYAIGTAIPLLAITYGGRNLLTSHPGLINNSLRIQKAFGVLMLITAIAIYFSWDRAFQTYILDRFPSYGTGLTKLEDNSLVQNQLKSLKTHDTPLDTLLESNYLTAPEFISGGAWINSDPLTLQSLRGKVVLIDFWTYTCINCIRTLPYTKAWWEKYKDKGFVLIGVHTPEFEFEKNTDNVRNAVRDFGITYPVVQDNNYATWQAYDNHYWPAHYLVDKNGKIRDTHFGEGDYDKTEQMIQTLLSETGVSIDQKISNPEYTVESRTPETYLGSARGDYSRIKTSGMFHQSQEHTSPEKGASLTYSFDAMKVFLVMRPKIPGKVGTVRVTLDGTDVGTFSGTDVKNGIVTIDEDRLYTLITLPRGGKHTLKLEFLDSNVELFAFTFG